MPLNAWLASVPTGRYRRPFSCPKRSIPNFYGAVWAQRRYSSWRLGRRRGEICMNRSRWWTLCVLLSFAITVATAQEPRASIAGEVTDSAGSLIANATVSVVNTGTGEVLRLTTNERGLYSAPLLVIGQYRVEVEQPGFKKAVRDNVQLRLGDRLQLDVALEVGQISESITVSASTPLLQAADASLGTVIDSKRLAELPIAHGNPYHLIALSTGVTFEGDPKLNRPYDPTHIVAYAMDGTKNNTSDVTLDGVANTALASSGSSNNSVTASYV